MQNSETLKDKNKIIDLWKRKRQQVKNKRRRNFLRRFILSFILLLLNGFLIYFCFLNASPSPIEAVQVRGSDHLTPDKFKIDHEPFWLFLILKNNLPQKIIKQNPLIANLELKPIIWPEPQLKIIITEYIPWARFSNGWLLVFTPGQTRLIKNTENLNFDNLTFASQTLILTDQKNYTFWANQAKSIQKLIYTISSAFPEQPLKAICLQPQTTVLYFSSLEVNLGVWDNRIIERATKLIDLQSTLKKYQNQLIKLDLSTESRAILKLREK